MANAFNHWDRSKGKAYFVSVKPNQHFIGGGRSLIIDLLDDNYKDEIVFDEVGRLFELGTISYRANYFKKLIEANIPKGAVIIPSDDEACWMAAGAVSKRNPFCAVVHSHGDNEYYRLLKIYQCAIYGIIAVSNKVSERVRNEISHFPLDRILINPCGLPTDEFKVNIYEKTDTIAWIGRMEENAKRVSDLPKIITRLINVKKPLTFKIIGNGEMFSFLNNFVKNYECDNVSIELLGWLDIPEIKRALATSKILLQCSNYEGMSITVMEAMSSGCSVVSSRVSGVEDYEDLDESKEVLFIYNVGDVDNAAALLMHAFNSYDTEIAKSSKKFALKHFDIKWRNSLMIQFFLQIDAMHFETTQISISNFRIIISGLIARLRLFKFKLSGTIR